MKDLSRAEIGQVIGLKTEGVVLGTALFFLAAGSLWAHFALGPVVLETPFLMCWILIHGASFVSLAFPRFSKFLPIASIVGLQFHFYASLRNYEMPFYPMAPIFFLIATLSLTAFRWSRTKTVWAFWALAWGSTAYWLEPTSGADNQARTAFFVSLLLNAFFVGSFLGTLRFFAVRMAGLVDGLGARKTFDDQRIHAASLQTLGELAVGLAHEIQNPLTAINGYSFQIQEDLKDEAKPDLELIRKANERIKHNVDRIIDISKVMRSFAREPSAEEYVNMSVRAAFEDTLALMRHNIKSQGIDLHTEFPEKDATVKGSITQISQVLVNLLSNARDACRGSDRKKISMGFSVKEGQVLLWVEDTGPGIPSEIKDSVFKAFYTTKPAGEGTGLGLYIAGIIADRHQGELKFECPRDAGGRILGTRFVLTLSSAVAVSTEKAA